MGVLPDGIPLSWQETKALSKHVQQHGVQQFINLYKKSKDRKGDPFKWGDEFEYIIVKFDDEKKEAKVACKSQELLKILNKKEKLNLSKGIWSAEFGAYQLESSPLKPFEGSFEHFKTVERDMRMRRKEVQDLLDEDECILTLVNSLRFCCKDFTYPAYEPRPDDPECIAKSCFIPDEVIYSGHPRYLVITRNIQMRRGERTQSKLKVFKDRNTKLPVEGSPIKEPDVIMFDNTFGCNLQVTFQGADMTETRYLYDQLAPLCPIIQAVTAASPIFRGYLTEIDNSYHFLGDGSDDRTAEERGLKPLKNNKCRLTKKRWDSIDSYLTPEADIFNDIELHYDQHLYDKLRNEGVDHVMAKHVAHIFMRDSLLMVTGKVNQNDEEETGHFDNINTTTWQTLRFKPALPNTELCWRVEFRPCDIQITDFENAAVSCFVILLTRAILHFNLSFLVPISKIDENMETAQKRDACRKEKFWFRKNVMRTKPQINGAANGASNGHANGFNENKINGHNQKTNAATNGFHRNDDYIYKNGCSTDFELKKSHAQDWELMTIDEIFNGKVNLFKVSI